MSDLDAPRETMVLLRREKRQALILLSIIVHHVMF